MTRKFSLFLISIFVFFSLLTPLCAATQTEWTVAAQKFTFTRNQTGSVADGIAYMFPSRILEKLSSNLYRTVELEESAQRELYKIRQERNSLFLQLSSAVKKRDSLVLTNTGKKDLELKLAKEEEKIAEIKGKLAQNLERQNELNLLIEQSTNDSANSARTDKTAGVTKTFFKSLFFSSDQDYTQEKIALYKKDISAVFIQNDDATDFEKQVVDAKINCLITGQITAFDEYMSVTVSAAVYPGAKQIAVITETGSVDDADIIASVIAAQLAPKITNSMPCKLVINQPVNLYIDDVLYKDITTELTIDSGVHFIQFTKEGYKNAGTNYYFEGNKKYEINVELEKIEEKTIFVAPKNLLQGDFVANGKSTQKLTDNASKITVNGNAVLSQFITEDKTSSFVYIPQNKITDGALYTVKLNPVDHNDYIEKRRRTMYLSYSILVTSLMPTIITKGVVQSYRTMLGDTTKKLAIEDLDTKIDTANKWVLASRIFTGVSIAAGAWFVFELYRYFNAANSVLPVNTKINFDYEPAEPLKIEQTAEQSEPTAETEPAADSDQTAQTEQSTEETQGV